ncbi:MAG: flagellar basal-body MS-ring/collar protein FliF, partial [Opitutaceae bacterium]
MKDFGQSLLNLWTHLGLNQRVSLIVAAVAVIGGLVALVVWSRQPDYQLLYGRLSEKDSAAIISQLQAQNIPHKIANGGSTVYVPSENVYRMRMELAAKGIPTGDGVGFEIFDKGQFGLSDFVQRTNYVRALQGELARTINQLDGVRSSRVMIVQPENRLLLTDQGIKPTASVFIELSKTSLETEAVNSIRHLVANAVQGLQPDQVAVVDNKGRVLSEDLKQDPLLGTASSQMRFKQQLEDYLAKKVETMLLPVLGHGQVVVRVSAEIETESTTLTQERFDPEGQVVRTQSTTDDSTNSSEARSGGQTGISANVPGAGNSQEQAARPMNVTETTRKTQNTNYEINRTLTNIVRNPGAVKNMSAAVFIAQRMVPPPATAPAGTKPAAQPRTPEELQALRHIVINALGLKLAPNQSPEAMVSLQEVPFTEEPVTQQMASLQSETRIQSWLSVGSRYLAVAAAAGLFLVFLRMLSRQKLEPVPMELLTEAPVNSQRKALQLNGGALTPELLNDLIRQKPANVG